MASFFNDDKTRCVTDETAALTIVGYVGAVDGDSFKGSHAGCFKDHESAMAWLRGDGDPDFRLAYSLGSET